MTPDEGNAHARLGPSGASQWISCPGSVLLVESLPVSERSQGSVYADEGTCAHELGYLKARLHFNQITGEEFDTLVEDWEERWSRFTDDDVWLVDVNRHTNGYVRLVDSEATRLGPGATVVLEWRVDPEIEGVWGTTDAAILSPTEIVAIDFKYGAGVKVEAAGNPQLKLYGFGCYVEAGNLLGDVERVKVVVDQPRMGHVDSETIEIEDLIEWVETVVRPAAAEALAPGGRLSPSEKACRWCDVSGRCPAQMAEAFSTDLDTAPRTLGPEEVSEALRRAPLLRRWLADLETAALTMAYEEETDIPGFKVVMSGGVRKVTDEEGALAALDAIGFSRDQTVNPGKIVGIGALEKLLGKEDFAAVLSPFVEKTEGRPSLAPDTDRRPAINPHTEAARVFADHHEEE